MRFPLFKDSTGKESFSFSMAASSFVILSLWLICWLVFASFGIPFPPFDVGIASGWFTPIAALYFGRRFTKAKTSQPKEEARGEE
jgi:hypothetical protein